MTPTLLVLLPVFLSNAEATVPRPVMGIVRFESRDPSSGGGWVGSYLTEALAVRLRRLYQWRWADADRLARAAGAEKTKPGEGRNRAWGARVGQAAGVDLLAFGVFDPVGSRVDVTMRLVRVKGEESLGGVSVDGRVAKLPDVVSRLADAVVAGVGLKLDAAQQRTLRRPLSLVGAAREWFGRGLVLERDPERVKDAMEAYARALALDDRLAEAHYRLGLAYRRTGQAQRSLAHLQAAVRLGLQQPHHLVALGEGLASAGRTVSAFVRLKQAVTTDPLLAEAYAQLGHVYLQQARHEEAETALRRAIELDPRAARPYCDLGNLLFVKGRTDEAEACYRSAIERDPRRVEALNNLGIVYQQQGRAAEAEKQFQTAIAVDPRGAHGYHNMARLLCAGNRFAEAVPPARRACELAPTDARVWLTLGQTLLGGGAVPESLPAFQKAVALDRTELVAPQARVYIERIRQNHPELFRK